MASQTPPTRTAITPIPSGGVLVLGVPFPNLHLAEGSCLQVLGEVHGTGPRMRILGALVEIRSALGRAA